MRRVFDFTAVIGNRLGLSVAAPALMLGLFSAPAHAQVIVPAPSSTPPAVVVQVPPVQPLPTLTPAQSVQLATLLDENAVAQGLRHAKGGGGLQRSDDELVRAALDLARAVHSGRLAEADFQKDWGLRPAAYNPLPGFADAVKRDRLKAWMASLPPPYSGYDGLEKGLATYRDIEAKGGWQTLATGPDMTLGASGARVSALRKRLAIEDSQVSGSGDKFDADLLEAVRRAQRRYGLNPSGIVAGQTLAALNMPVGDRIRQIMANMERWRWLPAELAKDRIQVNIAAAVLTVFDGDAPVASMRAVTGRPGDETPMLSSQIHSIVINPPWNVPTSIATRELWPKEKKNPGYLKRNGFKVIELEGGGKRLQQAAGDKSALGRFKFDFDNPYSVYLHDTPAQAGFSRYSRLSSHGCVRVEKPAMLADLLLKNDPAWGNGGLQAAVDKGKTVRARLPTPVSVYLFYWTAFASGNGTMNFRADPYNWDGILASKIEARSTQQQTLAAR